TRLRDHRLARVDAGDNARGPDALSDVEGIRPGAATQVEHMQAGPQVQALEDYRFAFLDVWDCVALVQEANEEIGVTSAIHLGEQRHVLAHGSLLLLCPARPASDEVPNRLAPGARSRLVDREKLRSRLPGPDP